MKKQIKCNDCVFCGDSNNGNCPSCGATDRPEITEMEANLLHELFEKLWRDLLDELKNGERNWAVDCAEDRIKGFIWDHYEFKPSKRI